MRPVAEQTEQAKGDGKEESNAEEVVAPDAPVVVSGRRLRGGVSSKSVLAGPNPLMIGYKAPSVPTVPSRWKGSPASMPLSPSSPTSSSVSSTTGSKWAPKILSKTKRLEEKVQFEEIEEQTPPSSFEPLVDEGGEDMSQIASSLPMKDEPNDNELKMSPKVKASNPASSSPSPSPLVKKKSRPAWASGWNATSSSSSVDVSSLTQPELSLEDAISKRRSLIGGWGEEAKSKTESSESNQVSSVPRIVWTAEGVWKLEGHEQDLKDLMISTPKLQARLAGGVRAEQEHEQKEVAKLYKGGPEALSRLQKDGVLLLDLTAKPSGLLYRQQLWRFSNAQGNLPYHKFKAGDGVLLTSYAVNSAQKGSYNTIIEGTILESKRDHLIIALEQDDSESVAMVNSNSKSYRWRLDQSIRDTTAQRQLEAIEKLSTFTSEDSPSEKLIRCVIAGSKNSSAIAEQPPIWVREPSWRMDAKNALLLETGLNSSQRRAVAKSMVSSFSLWQGPPGTGKTRTLLALIRVLVGTSVKTSTRWKEMGAVLACADTNAAIDNIVEGLASDQAMKGLRVVRVGSPAKVRDHLRHLTLEAQAEQTRKGKIAAAAREASRVTMDSIRSQKAKGMAVDDDLFRSAKQAWSKADAALKEAMSEILDRAHVICATCTGSGDPSLGDRTFKCVIIDESSQATEPAVLVPLTRGSECVVMAGDSKQLPPTVISPRALSEFSLDVTLFQRVSSVNGVQSMLLDTQYRMHPSIALFPSQHFYGGRLKDGVTADDKPPPLGFPFPAQKNGQVDPIAVIPLNGVEERAGMIGGGSDAASKTGSGQSLSNAPSGEGVSFKNTAEAEVAISAAHALLSKGDIATVAILTPYKGQVRYLEMLLRDRASYFPDGGVVVSSVDGFQGREADAVVFTTVRSNDHQSIGFVSDLRRLNVAITRPRRGLVIICNPKTLKEGSPAHWGRFLSFLEAKGSVVHPKTLPRAPWQ